MVGVFGFTKTINGMWRLQLFIDQVDVLRTMTATFDSEMACRDFAEFINRPKVGVVL